MVIKLRVNSEKPPISGLATAHLITEIYPVDIEWSHETSLTLPDNSHLVICHSNNDVLRTLARLAPAYKLYGKTAIERTQIDHWLSFSLTCEEDISWAMSYLEKSIAPATYLVANQLTIADFALFNEMHSRYEFLVRKGIPRNLQRWYDLISAQPLIQRVLKCLTNNAYSSLKTIHHCNDQNNLASKVSERKQEGKFADLPGAKLGKVIVRFPPEASGYLHIGHAKAALLNQYYAQSFNGKFIMRFDDTNPAKETVEFENVILDDLKLLQIKPDMFSYTSNYFDLMLNYCEELLKSGKAYVDDTPPEKMKQDRERKIESANRSNDVKKNFYMWEKMLNGTDDGQKFCVRAKINMSAANGCMRDPTIYRCKNEPHPRTGTKYKVYPTYDFACPIVDAIENVTHTLRTTEYHDRDEQFYWFIDALNLRKPYIWEYSRLNMTNTVLSKRKLTWFVESGLVDGWDDPRFPTVRGIVRRGMSVEGLKEFIIAQGSSKSVVFMNWDKIWAFNKKVIDPIAPRYTALEYKNCVMVNVAGAVYDKIEVDIHPKNKDLGKKFVTLGPRVYIDYADAETLKVGENATFINWGNLQIKDITKDVNDKVISVDAVLNLDNTDYKKTKKLTWLAVETNSVEYPPTFCVYFDHIISKDVLGKGDDFKQFIGHQTRIEVEMLGDPELKKCQKGDIIQLQRRGFFKVDTAYVPSSQYSNTTSPVILFSIPDGHMKETSSGLKISKNQPKEAIKTRTVFPTPGNDGSNDLNKQYGTGTIKNRETQVDADGEIERYLMQFTNHNWICELTISNIIDPITSSSKVLINEVVAEINIQGNKVRQLKTAKAAKGLINLEVNTLLSLKNEYKRLSGLEWTPNNVIPLSDKPVVKELLNRITLQDTKIRDLMSDKSHKHIIETAAKVLSELIAKYTSLTGLEWKPEFNQNIFSSTTTPNIQTQQHKSEAAPKNTMETNIQISSVVNSECEPLKEILSSDNIVRISAETLEKDKFKKDIEDQADKVREAKSNNANTETICTEVGHLLALKSKYKETFGDEYSGIRKVRCNKKVQRESYAIKEKEPATAGPGNIGKKVTRLGLEAEKEENLPEWYSQVITKGELIEYYDVSGCYILRPWSFAIWKAIKAWLEAELDKIGVKECYFPIFVSKAALEKEKTHISDFAPEVAWVTKSGESDLAEPIAIRPTSETVMYPAYAKWIQSYRDLPVRLNQWNNVVRWEFKHPQPFLRTREFLWQEGHTAFANKIEAEKEVLDILELYSKIYTNLLAIPVVKGRKTEKEKFAGGDYTTTVEAFISASGRAIQGATSHHLGQNFSKMFEIAYEDPELQKKQYAYQNSWGITTRTIGVMVMVHADNRGLVLPPYVASIQVIIVPCGITVNTKHDDRERLILACKRLEGQLSTKGIRCEGDYRENYSPGWRFNHWELKGVPVRIEVGPKDLNAKQIVTVRRDTGEKSILTLDDVELKIQLLLQTIHDNMLAKANADLIEHTKTTKNWLDFCVFLDLKNILLAPFCGHIACEEKIKADSVRDVESEPGSPAMGAKSLCIPFEQPGTITSTDKCIHPSCTNKPEFYTLFGRSY